MPAPMKKRSREEFEQDNKPTATQFGVGQTLNFLRNGSADTTSSPGIKDSGSSSEWQTVSRKKGKQRKENAGTMTIANGHNTYPAIEHSPQARVQRQVKLGDLQSLILYLLADGPSPNWVAIRNRKHFRKVVVLMLPGLERGMFEHTISLEEHEIASNDANETAHVNDQKTLKSKSSKKSSPDDYYPIALDSTKLPQPLNPFADMFGHLWPVEAPGDSFRSQLYSPISAILVSPLPKSEEYKHQPGVKAPREASGWQNEPTHIAKFLTSVDDLRENGFIVHEVLLVDDEEIKFEAKKREQERKTGEDVWVDSNVSSFNQSEPRPIISSLESATEGWKVLAIDCEMCQTHDEIFELTRISVVDWEGKIILDELVKPDNPITNYLTQYSGITKEMLDGVTTKLPDIQKRLLSLLTPHTILLGHSLSSDLNALKLVHHAIVDTSIIYPHPRGTHLKSSLKWLAQKYLQRSIQDRSQGHDSVEDARAVLDLVKLKCKRGPQWGTFEATAESIFKRIRRSSQSFESGRESTGAVIDWGYPKRGHGGSADFCIGCENDDDVVEGIKRAVKGDSDGHDVPGDGVSFVWARMRELEAIRGWWTGSKTADNDILRKNAQGDASAADGHANENDNDKDDHGNDLANVVSKSASRVKEVYDSLPPCTALIVYSGTGNPLEFSRLQELHQVFKKEYQVKKWDELSVHWTDVEEQAMRSALSEARQGIAFVTVK